MSKSQQQKCTHKILLNQQTAQKKLQTHLLELICTVGALDLIFRKILRS